MVVDNTCVVVSALAGVFARPSQLINPDAIETWDQQLDENEAGTRPIDPPLLVVQGGSDTIIGEQFTTKLVQRQCDFGGPVQYSVYPGAGHLDVINEAKSEILDWMADRLAGEDAPSNCDER